MRGYESSLQELWCMSHAHNSGKKHTRLSIIPVMATKRVFELK